MQPGISDFLEKSFFSCRQREKDFFDSSCNGAMQHIGFYSIFSLQFISSDHGIASGCRTHGVRLHGGERS